MSLTPQESKYLEKKIGRKPNPLEFQIVAAEWSEHCSYKSSKKYLKILPKEGKRVISGPGYDSGVLDVGDGYVVTVHIESHNHPSAVEPYGGAATGVGGVIRDILSAGTRPIAILDGLRFGNIEKDHHARWLFKNAIRGIADYGNCLGIPTVGGEIEFDKCFTNYALVDVAAIGFGKKENLIRNRAQKGDYVVLIGGSTGRDGIGGSQFASDNLDADNRSAVQIPDPFIEKLVIEVILEARNQKCIKAMKDLGGGGLSCAISETADALGIGIELDLSLVHKREQNMSPSELMVSESQERMLVITDLAKLTTLKKICEKFRVPYSVIGRVHEDKMMEVKLDKNTIAKLPSQIVANAPLLDRPSSKPKYLSALEQVKKPTMPTDISKTFLKMLSNPNIASKHWVYSQYDHEVGIRTVVKPGGDGASLRLDNGKFLSVKIDGNSKHCYINPREGVIGCFDEACRNVICTGAKPIGMVDHLQFGNPEDPEIFWTFKESVQAITDYAKYFEIPCVGGKVSLYNETDEGPIKPTPLIGVLGLNEGKPLIPKKIENGDLLIIVGITKDELGGSEYYEYIHGVIGGKCPIVDMKSSKKIQDAVLELIHQDVIKIAHDCSKGGLGVGISKLCISNEIGCMIFVEKIPSDKLRLDELLFSETHSRFLLVISQQDEKKVMSLLEKKGITHASIGDFSGKNMTFKEKSKIVACIRIDKAQEKWLNSLEALVTHG
ncbi:phosphoribosylformylglycinamidine synthase subunit PurL [Candidatus Nitrosotalea bavarica]|uniref:phosphoribosylformylglycinamidine synthase subunit PurL n=1 Tax=Candidatus Nitrosotalea bavarica TaxID=1903277 RepID=UPI000C6FDE0A|nr:phosphoribosylformylglycinamidine synthase subunit PurL [Candidatus Nitrosotalea bavarica]